jgi:membrane protease YdiL (CAAX protease family)
MAEALPVDPEPQESQPSDPSEPEAPPPLDVPTFGGTVLVVWAVFTAASCLQEFVVLSRWRFWPPPLSDFGPAHYAHILGRLSGYRIAKSLLLTATYLALWVIGLSALWKRRAHPQLLAWGTLMVLATAIRLTGTVRPDLCYLGWLLDIAGAIGVVRLVHREVPRSSWPLIALVVPVTTFSGRGPMLTLLAFIQIAWAFAAGRRILVRTRDVRARFAPRHRRRENIELAGVLLLCVASPMLLHAFLASDSDLTVTTVLAWMPYKVGIALLVLSLLLRDSRFHAYRPRTRRGWMYELAFAVWLCVLAAAVERAAEFIVDFLPDWPAVWDKVKYTASLRAALFVESFFSAFYEETVFRAFLITRLRPILGQSTAWVVVASSALFALMHGYSPRETVAVFAYGCVMAVVFVRTRSLTRLVIAHWISNVMYFLFAP